jgi:hypothetical protein
MKKILYILAIAAVAACGKENDPSKGNVKNYVESKFYFKLWHDAIISNNMNDEYSSADSISIFILPFQSNGQAVKMKDDNTYYGTLVGIPACSKSKVIPIVVNSDTVLGRVQIITHVYRRHALGGKISLGDKQRVFFPSNFMDDTTYFMLSDTLFSDFNIDKGATLKVSSEKW